MDYLDPLRNRRNKILLIVGYILITIMIGLTTVILFYVTEGFGVNNSGEVIQKGLLFFSSQPNPANIYINNRLFPSQTNTSFLLPAGTYNVKIVRNGYTPWVRSIIVSGGTVEHFDYPFLFPSKLTTQHVSTIAGLPSFDTQSLDRRWLLVSDSQQFNQFYLYDLSNITTPPVNVVIPQAVLSVASSQQSWSLAQWSSDNRHVLLKHTFDGNSEYILVDTQNPANSLNLNKTFNNLSFNQISMINNQYNLYYLYNSSSEELYSVDISTPQVVNQTISNVSAYRSYSNNVLLFVTSSDASSGKALVEEQVGTKIYIIKSIQISTKYLLNLTTYNSVPYVVVGDVATGKIYIYQDPVSQLNNNPDSAPGPIQVLLVKNPDYLSFSSTAQFIMAESQNHFAIYNLESGYAYNYTVNLPIDAPQTNASWMDGDRLTYVSGGKFVVFDYDDANLRVLSPATPNLYSFFSPDYSDLYSIVPATGSTNSYFTQTSMIAK